MLVGIVKNPRSGRGTNNAQWPELLAKVRAACPYEFLVEETTAPGSAKHQAKRFADEGCAIVVAAGGDGTVRDVMEGVLGTAAALAVLPLGTGNDFSRCIDAGPSVESAIAALKGSERKRIDIGRWHQGDRSGHFVNVAGCGFDAVVADRVNHGYRRIRGTMAYVVGLLQTLATYRATNLKIVVDGEPMEGKAMLCAFANATSYGGGMRIAPTADLCDGMLDLVLVGDMGRAGFLKSFPRVFKGTHLTHPRVTHRRFQRLDIESDPPVPTLVDGELLPAGPLSIEVVSQALEVIGGAKFCGGG